MIEVCIPPVFKTITKTMLEKGNPDCWKELKNFASLFGVDFDKPEKQRLPIFFEDGTETTIRFYRVNGKGGRKDCRYSIPAPVLKKQVDVGDTIAFTFKKLEDGRSMLVVNVTRNPAKAYLTEDEIKWGGE